MHEIAVFICVCIHTCILIRTVRRFYIVVVKLLLCESHPFFPFKKWIRSTFLEVSNEHAREHTHTRTHTSSTRPEIFQSGDSLFLACACARARARVFFFHVSSYILLLSASSTSFIAGRPFFPKKPCCLPEYTTPNFSSSMVTVIGYASTRFGTTLAFFATAKMAAFAASNSWPPPSQFLLYVTVNFISDGDEEAAVVVTVLPPAEDDADDPARNRKEASRVGKDDDKDDRDDDDRMAALRMYRVNARVLSRLCCLSDVCHFHFEASFLVSSLFLFFLLLETLNICLQKKGEIV